MSGAGPQEGRGRYWALHLGAPLALSALLLVVFETTDLDLLALEAAYDRAAGDFPWRARWLTEVFLHSWAKLAVIAFAAVLLVLTAAAWRWRRWRPWRRPFLYVVLCIGAGPALTGWVKKVSGHHCPWDLERFGGFATYTRLLERPEPLDPAGNCFPCGHASAGFALLSLYFALRDRRPRAARWALVGALAFGFVLGAGRVVQGAHFPSHVFATALLCWLIALGLYELLVRRRSRG